MHTDNDVSFEDYLNRLQFTIGLRLLHARRLSVAEYYTAVIYIFERLFCMLYTLLRFDWFTYLRSLVIDRP